LEATSFEPACGCGNFLIVDYRTIRLLEIDVFLCIAQLKGEADPKTGVVKKPTVEGLSLVDVDKFYGIEYDECAGQKNDEREKGVKGELRFVFCLLFIGSIFVDFRQGIKMIFVFFHYGCEYGINRIITPFFRRYNSARIIVM
jgi:hypothetical protein